MVKSNKELELQSKPFNKDQNKGLDIEATNDYESEAKYCDRLAKNCLVANKSVEDFEFLEIVKNRGWYARYTYLVFVLAVPLVFRYILYSSTVRTSYAVPYIPIGNGTINLETDWSCKNCKYARGVTLKSITVEMLDVRNPAWPDNSESFSAASRGFPSIALFASKDFKTWYNYWEVDDIRKANPFVTDWDRTNFTVGGNGEACLGEVYNTYIVGCLNNNGFANELERGQEVRGPPFNDRCYQVAGVCGVPCAKLGDQSNPRFCDNGIIPVHLLATNGTEQGPGFDEEAKWGSSLTIVDMIVIFVIFLECFGAMMKALPVLTGSPTQADLHKDVQVTGTTSMCLTTPIVTENEAIFLRSLLGRTLTSFHTIGGRHIIKGFYLDLILDEYRGKNALARPGMWLAWIDFVEFLCKQKTRTSCWPKQMPASEFFKSEKSSDLPETT